MMETLPIPRQDFVHWLKSQPPTSVVGYTRVAHACPVHKYCADKLDWPRVNVSRGFVLKTKYVTLDELTTDTYRTPTWMFQFINAIDMSNDTETRHSSQAPELLQSSPITAQECLMVLETIE